MSMTKTKIRAARKLALQFVEDADKLLAKIEADHNRERWNPATGKYERHAPEHPAPAYATYAGAISGTLRRRSMDLTRSLAQLRKAD